MFDIIAKYFPKLTERQQQQFLNLFDLYKTWNQKINVISRKDIDNLYEHHILHSLAIAKYINFKDETSILDFGTGGGFPGIPLSIIFPSCKFTLIDGTLKKIKVVQAIAQELKIQNVKAIQKRGEDEKGKYDFVVSRAVMTLPDLYKIVKKNISYSNHNILPNGIICLKGGDLNSEIKPYKKIVQVTPISSLFTEEWFKEKNIIYLPA